MWPFKKKPPALTLKKRVGHFWDWFDAHSEKFYKAIDSGHCSELEPETTAAVERLSPHLAWVYGPGENNVGHSLTLSGEGVLPKQFITEYWKSRAPRVDGWTFYSSRQPATEIKGFKMEFHGVGTFEPGQLWLYPWVDEQTEKIDLTVWHPLFAKIPDQQKWNSLFILLDEVLGEHGTQRRVGEIKLSDHMLKDSMPLWELREFVQKTETAQGWKIVPPTESFGGYSLKEGFQGMRGDIIAGSSRGWPIIREYFAKKGPIDHPVPDSGVDFCYIAFPSSILPKGKEVAFRAAIEDPMGALLKQNESGETLGGAMGKQYAYIDFIIYDGDESIQQVRQILREHLLPKDTRIYYLTKDKADKVIPL